MSHQSASSRALLRSIRKELGYTSIRDVLDWEKPAGRFVKFFNIVGLVTDFRAPVATRGPDWKCTLTLFDESTEDGTGIDLSIFRAREEMPQLDAGDVVLVRSAKVQDYAGPISLLFNRYKTVIHTYTAREIAHAAVSAKTALKPPCSLKDPLPTEVEHKLVARLFHRVDKYSIPDSETFNDRRERSTAITDKFSKLSDVREGQFYHIIAQVIRDPYQTETTEMETTELWISDYTQNESFYKFSKNVADDDLQGKTNTAGNWQGPDGRMCLQVTCFDHHATRVNERVRIGQWVQLLNVQVKFGRNGNNLEGFLRSDQDPRKHSERVHILATPDSNGHQFRFTGPVRDNGDTVLQGRLKDALKRKRKYDADKDQQLTQLASARTKRKGDHEEQPRENSKLRRIQRREKMRKEAEAKDRAAGERLGLHEHSRHLLLSSSPGEAPATSVADILDGPGGLRQANVNYRAHVRVVDFWPSQLEDFVSWHKDRDGFIRLSGDDEDSSESGGSDSDSSGSEYEGPRTWEWRFALQLEDADPKLRGDQRPRMWVLVDNAGAQMLTDLDARDLRRGRDEDEDEAEGESLHTPLLPALREKLFLLWGNLEEVRSAERRRWLEQRRRVAERQPPPDSSLPGDEATKTLDDDNDHHHHHRDDRARRGGGGADVEVSNKPFACCVRQYFVKTAGGGAEEEWMRVLSPDRGRARQHASEGEEEEGGGWVRLLGLFGTKISS
ncbi:hypothetical protein GGR56DRAFT_681791 [Xylariaceae sp. FL0804]|nr:hypothetical protein GGR56DRAFT_681791 [Xylariaceae sp. FL0804]